MCPLDLLEFLEDVADGDYDTRDGAAAKHAHDRDCEGYQMRAAE
jgi:hypothetical protein